TVNVAPEPESVEFHIPVISPEVPLVRVKVASEPPSFQCHVMFVAVSNVTVGVSSPIEGPLHVNVELAQFIERSWFAGLYVYVPLALPGIPGAEVAGTTILPMSVESCVVVPLFPSGSVMVMLLAFPAGAPVKESAAAPVPRKPAGAVESTRKVLMALSGATMPTFPSAPAKFGGMVPMSGRSRVMEHLVLPPWFTHFALATGNFVTPQGVVTVKLESTGMPRAAMLPPPPENVWIRRRR